MNGQQGFTLDAQTQVAIALSLDSAIQLYYVCVIIVAMAEVLHHWPSTLGFVEPAIDHHCSFDADIFLI